MTLPSASDFYNAKRDISDIAEIVTSSSIKDVANRKGGRTPTLAKVMKRLSDHAPVRNRGVWVSGTSYEVNDIWKSADNVWYVVVEGYVAAATEQLDIDGGKVFVHQVNIATDTVETLSELRLFEPNTGGQRVYVQGHTFPGLGGDNFFFDDTDTTTLDDDFRTIVTLGGARWRRIKLNNIITVEDFGVGNLAFSRALAAVRPGERLVTTQAIYTGLSEITHEFSSDQNGVEVEFLSDFIFTSDNGFSLKSLREGSIKIGYVAHNQLEIEDSLASPGVGVTLSSLWSVEVDVRGTANFLVGSKLVGGDKVDGAGNGMAFNDIKIRNAKAPITSGGIGVLVTTIPVGSTPGYFNENIIIAGFMRAEKGAVFKKGALQSDRFNGNKLFEPQFENVSHTGLELEYCSGNVIHHPRFEGGSEPSTWWINELSDCSRNDYYITGPARFSMFNFGGILQNYFGRLNSVDGGLLANQLFGGDNTVPDNNSHDIYLSLRRGADTPNNTLSFGGIPGQTRWSRYAGTVRDGEGVDKVFGLLDPYGEFRITGASGLNVVPNGVSYIETSTTGASDVTLQMSADRELDGMTVMMNISYFTHAIEVSKSSGGVVILKGVIASVGLYMLIYRNQTWKVSRVGDPLQ